MDSLCSLYFYMKYKIFKYKSQYDLETLINKFIKDKEGVSISLDTTKCGYSTYYTAIVYWKEDNG